MPKIDPTINAGHLITAATILVTAGGVFFAQAQETQELRSWLARHDVQLQKHSDAIAGHDMADVKSIEDRANFRAALIEIKADQKEILRAIKAFPSQ